MAQTINGFIARENGDEDFLSSLNWKTFVELAEDIGCFVIGRKTFRNQDNERKVKFTSIVGKRKEINNNAIESHHSPQKNFIR